MAIMFISFRERMSMDSILFDIGPGGIERMDRETSRQIHRSSLLSEVSQVQSIVLIGLIQYVIKNLRKSRDYFEIQKPFRSSFKHEKTSYTRNISLNYALRRAKFSYPAICQQLQSFKTVFNASKHTQLLCSEWNGFTETWIWYSFKNFNSDKTVSTVKIRCLLARHNIICQVAANKLMPLKMKRKQERLRWCKKRWQSGANYWNHFVLTYECKTQGNLITLLRWHGICTRVVKNT